MGQITQYLQFSALIMFHGDHSTKLLFLIPCYSFTENSTLSSINLLAPTPFLPSNNAYQLMCIFSASQHTVHVTWNISGTRHKGRIISREEIGGIWTFQSLFSLTEDIVNYGGHVICEVWLSSSPVQISWTIKDRGNNITL